MKCYAFIVVRLGSSPGSEFLMRNGGNEGGRQGWMDGWMDGRTDGQMVMSMYMYVRKDVLMYVGMWVRR